MPVDVGSSDVKKDSSSFESKSADFHREKEESFANQGEKSGEGCEVKKESNFCVKRGNSTEDKKAEVTQTSITISTDARAKCALFKRQDPSLCMIWKLIQMWQLCNSGKNVVSSKKTILRQGAKEFIPQLTVSQSAKLISQSSGVTLGYKQQRWGVIGTYLDRHSNDLFFLFVQRRYSIGYTEILLGNYSPGDAALVQRLIEDATLEERSKILTSSFRSMYLEFWGELDQHHQYKYRHAKHKFHLLRRGLWKASTSTFHSWQGFVSNAVSEFTTPAIEFPKGRKTAPGESDLDCAIREFGEETACLPTSYELLDSVSPIEESFVGMNGKTFQHQFYLARFRQKDVVEKRQNAEIGAVYWLTYQEGLTRTRPHEHSKRNLLTLVNNRLRESFLIKDL